MNGKKIALNIFEISICSENFTRKTIQYTIGIRNEVIKMKNKINEKSLNVEQNLSNNTNGISRHSLNEMVRLKVFIF